MRLVTELIVSQMKSGMFVVTLVTYEVRKRVYSVPAQQELYDSWLSVRQPDEE